MGVCVPLGTLGLLEWVFVSPGWGAFGTPSDWDPLRSLGPGPQFYFLKGLSPGAPKGGV